ncbi:hypothetical protein GCM10017784_39490 [Deinococcus indicus]|uniref:hypothetical protein n=1 Tax=Deinococcus indicus TaxID=223556 RepID=UPI00198A7434|nr:hypothetical protein [Deinococcus indicus]GHG40729.1 hypothetical protein GCM10017784_39490 [Deinococcus indicus]
MTCCFTAHFPEFRKNQVELLSLMVLALLGGKDVRHAELAARFLGSAHTDSVIRRVERFFDRHPIQPADVARVVLTLLPSAKPREFILDRTNWKYGQTDVNVLLLAVIWRGVAIPLLYELLPHGGGSYTEIRHTLMDDALCLLRAADIRVLYADREFVGYDWIQGLARRGIPICVRLRSDTLMDDWTAQDWLSRLQTGMAGLLVDDTVVYRQPMNVLLTHTRDGEALIIASNAGSVTTGLLPGIWTVLNRDLDSLPASPLEREVTYENPSVHRSPDHRAAPGSSKGREICRGALSRLRVQPRFLLRLAKEVR